MESTQNQNVQEPNEDMHEDALSLWQNIKKFLNDLLDIRHDTDRDATVEAVRKDIPFKGHIAWILIFSIFVASIGLNVSSTAVVIGAMLISPLMGPIVGVGLSAAINDGEMMKRSFINLSVMIFLSVLTAFVYFSISPLKEITPELEARTAPNILDVLIAIFGGLALIVAKTKKGTIASVIFGVAIATALMPPLCTVGYGLAVGNLEWAGGAMYLFFINAVFIALATFLVSKLLRFPLVKYANAKKRRRTAAFATIIAICVLAPSIYFFVVLWKKQIFTSNAKDFITQTISFPGTEVLKTAEDPEKRRIDVYLIGNLVPQNEINLWEQKLKSTEGLELCNLVVHQGADQSSALAERLSSEVKTGILEALYVKNQEVLSSKDAQIELLEKELSQLRAAAIPFDKVGQEAKILYAGLDRFAYANMVYNNFSSLDTITTFKLGWVDSIPKVTRLENNKKLGEWLKTRFNLDTLVVEEYSRGEYAFAKAASDTTEVKKE